MKKNEKIYGIHPAIEFIKVSPDRIINIWIQEELKSESILSISNMAESIGLSIQHSKKETLDKITNKQNHQGIVLEVIQSADINTKLDECTL